MANTDSYTTSSGTTGQYAYIGPIGPTPKKTKSQRIGELELEVSMLKVQIASLEAKAHAPCAWPYWPMSYPTWTTLAQLSTTPMTKR